jgi:hypothetical protein
MSGRQHKAKRKLKKLFAALVALSSQTQQNQGGNNGADAETK